jgi:7-cyano-7-deazaguanine synthase
VSVGLAWEACELKAAEQFLDRAHLDAAPLARLTVDMTDVYSPSHWARTGHAPAYDTPDEDVYLAGRNIVLLGKAGVFAAARKASRLVIGTLDHNPFPDATPGFRAAMAQALSLGLAHAIEIAAPFASVEKAAVIRRGAALGLPLEFTLSCMNPPPSADGAPARHCGLCSKCRERHNAYLDAKIADPTDYADRVYTSRPPT